MRTVKRRLALLAMALVVLAGIAYGQTAGRKLGEFGPPTPLQTALYDMVTGVQTGLTVTVNADTAKFDVAAGTGWIVDCTTPTACTRTPITCPESLANTVTDLATTTFTSLTIDSARPIRLRTLLDPYISQRLDSSGTRR